MEPKISALSIKQFRALRQVKFEGLGRVNPITGRNNTGKSSVLEAIRILASNASMPVIAQILRFREEDEGDIKERTLDRDGMFLLSSLFHGFPEFSADLTPIVIASSGGQRPMKLSMKVAMFSEERLPDGARKLVPYQ